MLLIAIRKGGVKCSSACPFYTETGKVNGVRDVPLKTHCRMTMNPWMLDCDVYNPMCIDKMEVTEEQWKTMQKAIRKRAIRQRKLYPEVNENGRPVGCTWTQGRWNAEKARLSQKCDKNAND